MREYFINADFDLSLRRGRRREIEDARARIARELVFHSLLLGIEGDSILVPEAPDAEFFTYLETLRIPVPSVRLLSAAPSDLRFTPFGWNAEAERLNLAHARPAPHPPLEVVRRVNGRTFSAEVEQRHWGHEEIIGTVHSTVELEALLDRQPTDGNGFVVKSEHGNGAFGNRRLRSRRLLAGDRTALGRLFREDDRAVVEPWRDRVVDLASVFEVDESGGVGHFRIHEVLNTSDGALRGDVFDRTAPAPDRWGSDLEEVAGVVAQELAGAGYFGPVCVDSFVWTDGGNERLRPVVDINARLFMAAAPERLWRAWGCDRVISWRLLSSRRLKLPETGRLLEASLGEAAFDPVSRCGILLTSPLNEAGRRRKRTGVVFSGRDRAAVESLDRWFCRRFAT